MGAQTDTLGQGAQGEMAQGGAREEGENGQQGTDGRAKEKSPQARMGVMHDYTAGLVPLGAVAILTRVISPQPITA